MTLAIVTVLPEPVTPRSVMCRSPAVRPSISPAAAVGWSPARSHGSDRLKGARPLGRSIGTWRVSPRGMGSLHSRTNVLMWSWLPRPPIVAHQRLLRDVHWNGAALDRAALWYVPSHTVRTPTFGRQGPPRDSRRRRATREA